MCYVGLELLVGVFVFARFVGSLVPRWRVPSFCLHGALSADAENYLRTSRYTHKHKHNTHKAHIHAFRGKRGWGVLQCSLCRVSVVRCFLCSAPMRTQLYVDETPSVRLAHVRMYTQRGLSVDFGLIAYSSQPQIHNLITHTRTCAWREWDCV